MSHAVLDNSGIDTIRLSPAAKSCLRWLSVTSGLLSLPIFVATFLVPYEILGFKPEYPELVPVLNVYALVFAVAGVVAVLTALVVSFALRAHARGSSGQYACRLVSVATVLTAGLTLIMLGLFISAFFVPAGGPLFAPMLLFLVLIGAGLTMAFHRWG